MAVVAVTMVKNEADVIETCIRHMAANVDHVIVADNGSTDGTRELLDTLPCEVMDDPDPAYYQSAKMTGLAHYAGREHHATWIVPFDADEIWVPVAAGTIAEQLAGCDADVAPARLYDHVVTDADPSDLSPQQAMCHRMHAPAKLHKVAARYDPALVIAMGNHQATYAKRIPDAAWDLLEVRHFPIRSPQQYLRKARQGAAALALTDLPDDVGVHWRDWNRLADEAGNLDDAFLDNWFFHANDPRVVYDPARLAGQ